jgi:hypothetical protein
MPKKAVRKVASKARKSINIDPERVRAARIVLGARSDKAAIHRALELVVFQDGILAALDELGETLGVRSHAVLAGVRPPAPQVKRKRSR